MAREIVSTSKKLRIIGRWFRSVKSGCMLILVPIWFWVPRKNWKPFQTPSQQEKICVKSTRSVVSRAGCWPLYFNWHLSAIIATTNFIEFLYNFRVASTKLSSNQSCLKGIQWTIVNRSLQFFWNIKHYCTPRLKTINRNKCWDCPSFTKSPRLMVRYQGQGSQIQWFFTKLNFLFQWPKGVRKYW